jgi:hypothetical protein
MLTYGRKSREQKMGIFDFRWLFGQEAQTPEEAVDIAEAAELSIEQRMARISERLKTGGYKRLDDNELQEITADIEKILEFIDHAVTIIEGRTELPAAQTLVRRLRHVRTRANNILKKRQQILRDVGAA